VRLLTLKDLITQGEEVKKNNSKEGLYGSEYLTGEDYELWIAKCIIFLDNHSLEFNKTLIEKFKKASEKAVGNGLEHYNAMMGILKAFDEMS
jgi:hypothetical protein